MLKVNWSFSKLDMYESCAYQFKLRYIDKLPEPERKDNNPLERGNRIHGALENFVKGRGPMDTESKKIEPFIPALEHLQMLYSEGMVSTEDNWLYDRNWNPCKREDVWLWSKLDFNVTDEANAHSIVGDYKSGKSQYKVINHVQQMQLYAATTAIRQPWANTITVELWYVDEGHVKQTVYTREQALAFIGRFDSRAAKMYEDRIFKPNPNKFTCKWCPFGIQNGTGACKVAV